MYRDGAARSIMLEVHMVMVVIALSNHFIRMPVNEELSQVDVVRNPNLNFFFFPLLRIVYTMMRLLISVREFVVSAPV